MQNTIENAAENIRLANEHKTPCSPIRHLFDERDIQAAYRIQDLNNQLRIKSGRKVIGKKIGLTSFAVQEQLGVREPDFGLLFDDMRFENGAEIPSDILMQAKAEAELAFVLKADLNSKDLSLDDIYNAIDYALVAIEIVGSRIENWDINIMDTVADNASASHFVIGKSPIALEGIDLQNCQMQLYKNGELASEGTGKACMGNPLIAVKWLAEKMAELQQPLQKGELILSGALGPMVNISKGGNIKATIENFETVEFLVT